MREQSYRWQGRVSAREDTLAFRARTVLPSGRYEYAIEAYDRHANRAALGRGQLMIPTYGADTLVLSDLLVADAIRRKRTPAEVRGDLQIWGSADLAFGEGEPVGLYWEVYGLATLEGIARYEVTLEVRDAEQRSLPVRVLDAIASVFAGGPEERPQLSWSREVALVDRDRAIDWIMLGGIAEGQQRIVVTLRDLVSGRRAASERQLMVVPREKE